MMGFIKYIFIPEKYLRKEQKKAVLQKEKQHSDRCVFGGKTIEITTENEIR